EPPVSASVCAPASVCALASVWSAPARPVSRRPPRSPDSAAAVWSRAPASAVNAYPARPVPAVRTLAVVALTPITSTAAKPARRRPRFTAGGLSAAWPIGAAEGSEAPSGRASRRRGSVHRPDSGDCWSSAIDSPRFPAFRPLQYACRPIAIEARAASRVRSRGKEPLMVDARELTQLVSLTLPNGTLNPDAVGWARSPLVDTAGITRRGTGR